MTAYRASLILMVLAGACGPGPGASGTDGGDTTGDSCTNASDCAREQVCDPQHHQCASGVSCDGNDQCGPGGYCDGSTCAHNTTGGPCDDSINCLTGETCTDGHCGCDGVTYHATAVTPNMLIVLDRSASMNQSGGGASKWNIARNALSILLDQFGDRVRFGLDMFASNNDCSAGSVVVDIGDSNAGDIEEAYGGADADSNTPIRSTLAALMNYDGLADPDHPNYVLLLTDGGESCQSFSTEPVVSLKGRNPSVKTFVIGFGSGVSKTQLNELAAAGGTARSGTTKYYQADDAGELSAALDDVIGTVLTCSYKLDQVPDDLSELYVYQDGNVIGRDDSHADGWDYDPNTGVITFYGDACQSLEDGQVIDLTVVYGCPVDVE